MAWTDTDGRIVAVTIPEEGDVDIDTVVLPQQNEIGEPLIGTEAGLVWSPGGRYLAIEHHARNQFTVISLADLGDPANPLDIGRIVQATPDRFNSFSPVWGKTSKDFTVEGLSAAAGTKDEHAGGATALFFLSDRMWCCPPGRRVRGAHGLRRPVLRGLRAFMCCRCCRRRTVRR